MGVIYSARNRVSGKRYIGKSVGCMEDRRRDHEVCAVSGNFLCPLFHRALKGYGIENFEWTILYDDVERDDLDVYEIAMIRRFASKYPNGYNMTDGGDGVTGHSEETIRKMKKSAKNRPPRSEESRRKTGNVTRGRTYEEMYGVQRAEEIIERKRRKLKGRKVSGEQKRMISRTLSGRKRSPRTAEEKEKIGRSRKGKTWEEIYGVKVAAEMKKKRSEAMVGKPSNAKGKKWSAESRARLSKVVKKLYLERKGL